MFEHRFNVRQQVVKLDRSIASMSDPQLDLLTTFGEARADGVLTYDSDGCIKHRQSRASIVGCVEGEEVIELVTVNCVNIVTDFGLYKYSATVVKITTTTNVVVYSIKATV
jgi:hypothetical protein